MNKPPIRPLVVDLDGTLIKSDLLHESLLIFLLQNPLRIFSVLKWAMSGRPFLKEKLAQKVALDVEFLPYNQEVIDLIKEEREKHRPIVLATASHIIYAKKIADHFSFDQFFATEGKINLSGNNKREKLVQEFGKNNFDYVGNSKDDLLVWKDCYRAYAVNVPTCVEKKIISRGEVQKIIIKPRNSLKDWAKILVKTLRLHQWVRNLLIFVPLIASHQINDLHLVAQGALAFLFFGLCASHVYIFNDLVDLPNDRRHKIKRCRPLAAGLVSIPTALIISVILLLASFTFSLLLLPKWFTIALFSYYILTLAYSLFLKRFAIIDIVTLASLYSLRIIAGTFAFSLILSFWLLAFSMFIFLSLSLVKRYAELRNESLSRYRAYYFNDLEMLSSFGAASGYLSVMILALYIRDESTIALYSHPRIIWFACPLLLYWISRVWMITHRGQMQDDPVLFAIKDRVSWIIGALLCLIFWYAT